MLEKKEIEEALSLAEDSIAIANSRTGGSLREKLLGALKDRAMERRAAITARRRRVIDTAISLFENLVVAEVNNLASQIDIILSDALPGSSAKIDVVEPGKEHYFKVQIVEIANMEGYYCDFETFHKWVRLKIKRPREQEEDHSEIVVSLHSLGRQFTGVISMTAYFAERIKDEDRTITLRPRRLADRSLSFSYLENVKNVELRMREWLEMALNMGLAEFQKNF
jgi:hypothetical protein